MQKNTSEDLEKFYSYFKKLNARKQQNEEYILTRSEALGPLDYEISEQETVTAIDLLKTGKAPGVDNILCELLKHGKEALKGPLTILFNKILTSGRYPTLWSHGLIIPIFKKDDPSNPENYRGITLLSAMGKIFTSIMNSRLCDYLIEKGIITPEQCGFRKKHGTQDSIFILKALIDKYVKSKPKKSNNLLFTCFVDFSKAFDSIPRGKLFQKLKLAGVTGRFLEILHSMYSNDKSSVKIENMLTPAFRCHTGVKQGCMLSPTLFNLYLSDLSEELKAKNLNDVELNELPLSCMLYADDLVIFSKSKNGLQDYLDSLSEYCKENDLSVNLNKTKVLIFNNCGRTMNKHVLYYRGSKLDNVSNYKYLGLQFRTCGNFTYTKQEIKKVALKALYKVRKEMGDHFRDDVQLTMKIFDTVISPILTYGRKRGMGGRSRRKARK